MDPYQILAYIGGFLVIISALPQVYKIVKHKSAKDVSLPMFILLVMANILWFIYGVHLNDLALIFTNLFAGTISLTNVILIFRYTHGKN